MSAEPTTNESVPYPGAWVLHCVYSEWDDDLSSQSFMLGVGGVFLFTLVLCTTVPIACFCWGSMTGYSPAGALFALALVFSPALAAASLTAMIPLLRHGNLTLRSLTTIAFGFAILALVVTTVELLFGRYQRSFAWDEMFTSTILVASLLLVTSVLPICFAILLYVQSTLKLRGNLLCSIPLVILISLASLLVEELLRGNSVDWDSIEKPAIIVFGPLFGGTVLTVTLSFWRRSVLTEATVTQWDLSRLSIIAIMELTFLVALVCSTITAAQFSAEDSTVFVVLSAIGIIPAGITFGWLHVQLGDQTQLRYWRMAALFGGSTLALGAVFALLLASRFGFAGNQTSVLLGLAIGLEFNIVFTVTLLIGIGWLQGCGWQFRPAVTQQAAVHSVDVVETSL